MTGRVLIVAASDSGGGAGIQADIKTVMALGGYATTAVTAITAQNTNGVFATHAIPAALVAQQMRVVLEDIGADVIKIGMLANAEIIEAVGDVLDSPLARDIPVVLDPVMLAKDGTPLLDLAGFDGMKRRLALRAYVLTPNLPEAEALTGAPVRDPEDRIHVATMLLSLGAQNVFLTGGHLPGNRIIDVLVGEFGHHEFQHPRIETVHTHGTGCTLASAIAAGLARGLELPRAISEAEAYLEAAIRAAPGLGNGQGPLGHGAAALRNMV
jgi:hydroxymethylpyrimidine/phosphomethylpyrimidine kinase